MKKIILALSLSLLAFEAKPIDKTDSIVVADEQNSFRTLNDSADHVVVFDYTNIKTEQEKTDKVIQNADLVIETIGAFCPQVKPYVSIIGMLTTVFAPIIVHIVNRRRRKREIKELKNQNSK